MPIVYNCAGRTGDRPINIAELVQAAWIGPIGPQPGQLEVGTPVTTLQEGMTNLQLLSTAKSKTVTSILFSCAAVFYSSMDPRSFPGVWCHHAPSGLVTDGNILTAIQRLGNPACDSILVVYAHDRPPDAGHDASMNRMINRGMLSNHIVEIPSLPMPKLGVDYQGMLGY